MTEQSVKTLIREAAARIAGESARVDAEILAGEAFAMTRAQLIAHGDHVPSEIEVARYRDLVRRRARGEPIAYIRGRREFWSLELEVGPAVLIPRPETEQLVELALARLPERGAVRIADLGTGSGAIALALAKERPDAEVHAVDRSEPALGIARRNAERLGLGNVRFHHGDWLEPLAGMRFDLIASNPPYVAEGDPHLERGDARAEPRSALAAGPDGLDDIRRIAMDARHALAPGGWLLLEHGHDQGEAVREILAAQGYHESFTAPDLAGHDRVTGARGPARGKGEP